jgi:hypothetical protein
MKIIPFEEFKAWILAQPDERKIDMGEDKEGEAKCGCLMIQYARENKIQVYSCGMSEYYNYFHNKTAEITKPGFDFIEAAIIFGKDGDGIKTFGEAKFLLKKKKFK